MTEHFILLKVSCSKEDPDLLDKIAGRAWTMDSVEDVTASMIEEKDIPQQLKESMK